MATDRYSDRWRCGWTLSEGIRKRFFAAYGKARTEQQAAISVSEFAESLLELGLDELKRQGKSAA